MSGSESQSPRPPMPLWVILVTLLGGAFLLQRGKYSGTDKVTSSPAVVTTRLHADALTPDDRMKAPLREFLGLPLVPAKKSDVAPRENDRQENLTTRIEDVVGLLEFLIVSVADPIDAATNYRFDLQIDTLHKALAADGYVPDHFFLPWGPPEKDKPSVHRTEPGVLLYRRNGKSKADCDNPDGRSDLLLVYLVGETPTSGIHKQAFLAAVQQINELGEKVRFPKRTSPWTIRVAGPVFTGASDSLALAIRQACHETNSDDESGKRQIDFQVITGTAVSIDRTRFKALAGPGNADLHSTLLPGNVLRKALIDHVVQRSRPWQKVRIAWLTETATGYGFSSREQAVEAQSKAEIIEFHFPINISNVRSGYAESRRRERSGQMGLGPETSRLPIPFDDPGTARDVPPMQTPQVTAPTAELILGQILLRIRNEAIKYVGISSTDPRDPIFLADLIQEQCPNVQIMLVGSDVLHLHSEYYSIMHGTLVSSSYPLHPEALDLCFPFGEGENGNSRSIVLSNQVNYGLYNAVLFLRGLACGQYTQDDHLSNNGKDELSSHNLLKLHNSEKTGWPGGLPLGYSMPFEEVAWLGEPLRPRVWISRIGSTGICPITVGATDKKLDATAGYTLSLEIEEPPGETLRSALNVRSRIPASLNIASLIWLVIAAIYCVALFAPQSIGNWAKALAMFPDHAPEFQGAQLYLPRLHYRGIRIGADAIWNLVVNVLFSSGMQFRLSRDLVLGSLGTLPCHSDPS